MGDEPIVTEAGDTPPPAVPSDSPAAIEVDEHDAVPLEAGDHGRASTNPWRMPPRAWWDVLVRTWKETGRDNISLVAAGVAFYSFLAFVPMLAAMVMLYGLVADPSMVGQNMSAVTRLLPPDAARIVVDQLQSVTTSSSDKTGWGLAIAILLALYGAMRGASAIIMALNVTYEQYETRSFLKKTFLSFAFTVGLVTVGIIGVLAISSLAAVEALLDAVPAVFLVMLQTVFWALAAMAVSTIIGVVYRYAPDRRKAKLVWLTPGSAFATVGWLGASILFGLYVGSMGDYNATYGALGAVVVLLMWLYLSAFVLLLGAQLNAELEHQTARDTTEGHEKPLGERGAHVADTVGAAA